MKEQAKRMNITAVIVDDPGESSRGYSLVDREFFLKYPQPIKAEGEYLDGKVVEAEYFVVSLKEWMRVVPESRDENYKFTDEILIPKHLAVVSAKPCYMK